MPKTIAPLDAIDEDLEAACLDRHETWRRLAIKDNQTNRDAYAEACTEVDALLDMRFEMQAGDMVDAG